MEHSSPKPQNKNIKVAGNFFVGNLCILVATIFWGVNVSFTKALIPDWMTSEGISAVRLIGGALLFWIGSIFVRNDRIARSDWKKLIAGGVSGSSDSSIFLSCR